jgi:hypothetical protein
MAKSLAGEVDSVGVYSDFGAPKYGLHLHDANRDCVYLIVRPSVVPWLNRDELVVCAAFRRVSAEEYAETFGLTEGDEVDESLDETFGRNHRGSISEDN